jgi:hypothetical protein
MSAGARLCRNKGFIGHWASAQTKKALIHMGRGPNAPAVPPKLSQPGLRKNPVGDATGNAKASFTHSSLAGLNCVNCFALITVAIPAQATRLPFRPATLRPIRRRRSGENRTSLSLSVPSFRRVLFLFIVFQFSDVGQFIPRCKASVKEIAKIYATINLLGQFQVYFPIPTE